MFVFEACCYSAAFSEWIQYGSLIALIAAGDLGFGSLTAKFLNSEFYDPQPAAF